MSTPPAKVIEVPVWVAPGQRITHLAFGEGIVDAVHPNGGDVVVEARFDASGRKLLALSAAADKLSPAPPSEADRASALDRAMKDAAAHAVAYAAGQGVLLDGSLESLRTLETLLDRLSAPALRGLAKLWRKPLAESDIRRLSLAFGAYIAQVLAATWGGCWKEPGSSPGQQHDQLTFIVEGIALWPSQKVEKRLRHGAEDNIWHYVQTLKAQLAAGRSPREVH